MVSGILAIAINALWLILPAYIPNSTAAVFGGGKTVDFGKEINGKRILGDGKTWRGLFAGISVGALVALGLNQINSAASTALGLELASFSPALMIALPTGAMLGDMAGSLVKRRLDRERGAPVPLLDQLDFLAGALAAGYLIAPAGMDSLGLEGLAFILVFTPLIHIGTNIAGYKLGVKNEPW